MFWLEYNINASVWDYDDDDYAAAAADDADDADDDEDDEDDDLMCFNLSAESEMNQ